MKTFVFDGKEYNFDEDITPKEEGDFVAVATSSENEICQLYFIDGKLMSVDVL